MIASYSTRMASAIAYRYSSRDGVVVVAEESAITPGDAAFMKPGLASGERGGQVVDVGARGLRVADA